MGIMGAALLFSFFFALDVLHAYRLSKFGVQAYCLTTAVSIPVSIVLGVVEWKRPERALKWPIILFVVSALPPLFLMAIFWNVPD